MLVRHEGMDEWKRQFEQLCRVQGFQETTVENVKDGRMEDAKEAGVP